MWLEGVGQFKKCMTSSEVKPGTFRLVPYHRNPKTCEMSALDTECVTYFSIISVPNVERIIEIVQKFIEALI